MSLEHSPARQERPKTERQRLTELQKTVQRRSWTILEWCAMRGYSRGYFYKLRAEDNAPDVIGEDKATRITDAADARWQKRQEQKAKRARA
jgi:hypothetical protein